MDKREKAYLRSSKNALNNHFTYILENVKKIEKKLNEQQKEMTKRMIDPPKKQVLLNEYNQTKETYRVWNQRLADVEEQILDVRKLLNDKNDYQYKSKMMKRKGYVVGTAKSYLSHNVERSMNDIRKTTNFGIKLYTQQVDKNRPSSKFQITNEELIKARAALKSTQINSRENQDTKKRLSIKQQSQHVGLIKQKVRSEKMPNKKNLKKEKELLNKDFKNVCKEWQSMYKELIKGQKEIQEEGIALKKTDYRAAFSQALESGEYKNGMSIYNKPVELIQKYQTNLSVYGVICQKMHNLEQQIYSKRKEIKDKPSYIKGSKTFKQWNYKEGFALEALKNSYNNFYPNEVASVISTIKDLAGAAKVKLYLYNEQEMSQALNNLLPSVRREGQIDKQNPNLGNIVEQARKNAESTRNSSVQKRTHQVR
ncbi:hypothetical protein [Enterococcus faecium]|uniref:hypothetical protein n=2 Tax=Enterococcus faecium TaxID=1352 RepID=UPI001F5B6DB9|nr:hypothetical protein [Enterococcus faecium]